MTLVSIEQALELVRKGQMLIVVDDDDRENEGDLYIPAACISPEHINFMSRYGRGLICAALHEDIFTRLNIPMMVRPERNTSKFQTGFGVSVGAAKGVTTGISAFDRAKTVEVLANPQSVPSDLSMPGHIFPLKAQTGGVLRRRGHTEAAVDLARLAGFTPAGVICEVMNEDGTMARRADLDIFARKHQLSIVSIADLAAYRHQHEDIVQRVESATIPTEYGSMRAVAYMDHRGLEHLAIVMGTPGKNGVLTRLHSECLTGDVFGSRRCDCGEQLDRALASISDEGSGVLIYLRQEGRGIGLANKIRAYALQEKGMDTVEANRRLGLPDDARTYDVGAAILRDMGIASVRLMTNNPMKIAELEACGVKVDARLAHQVEETNDNRRYLKTKIERLGHLMNQPSLHGDLGS
ncbi:MAG: 3,4-dihydroxy-2-butanone-4-phosphate synthase [Acidobacteria bacterium]|nr:3,4-dihydroxy-2-butanone-4-phosphate synthase [Acidobacteriota bacterium]